MRTQPTSTRITAKCTEPGSDVNVEEDVEEEVEVELDGELDSQAVTLEEDRQTTYAPPWHTCGGRQPNPDLAAAVLILLWYYDWRDYGLCKYLRLEQA